MRDSKRTAKIASKVNWSIWIIAGSSIPIALIVVGIIKMLMTEFHGVVNTTTEQAVFFGGLFLAPPCGLLNIIAGINALSKGLMKKWSAITGIIIGALGILIGIISWAWHYMIWSFVNHFG